MNKKVQRVQNVTSLKKTLSRLRKQGKKIAFTNGCFDLLHPGHIKIFTEAKAKADVLVVGINSDASVRKIKGKSRPVLDQWARAQNVSALRSVDYVVLFCEETPRKLIEILKPDYLVKGGDWKKKDIVGADLAKKVFRVKVLKNYSTTRIIEKILKKENVK